MNGGIFFTVKEAQVLIEGWRQEYDRVRPHISRGAGPRVHFAQLLAAEVLKEAI